jgi:hypothetical protein
VLVLILCSGLQIPPPGLLFHFSQVTGMKNKFYLEAVLFLS